MVAQILCIGQSDSCAGTGIQADIKTAQAFGVYAATVVTAVTAQNTCGVQDMQAVSSDLVIAQIKAVMDDLAPAVIKTGMMANTDNIRVVGEFFDSLGPDRVKVVVDPVMTSHTGDDFLDKEARDIMKRSLLLYADILTPNIQEAMVLTGMQIKDIDDMCHAAEILRTLGPKVVILKGGALSIEGNLVYDVFADDDGVEVHSNERMDTKATHGAGTTMSAGLAACLAQGMDARTSFDVVRAYLNDAIVSADVIGSGFGPVNHSVSVPVLEKRHTA